MPENCSPIRRRRIAGILALAALLLAACPAKPPVESEKTVRVVLGVDMAGVNELLTGLTLVQTAVLYFGLFMPLLEEQADYETGPPTLAPRLAESYELSPDRTVLTFHLRPDAVWSDGVPITAEDVRWTWQAQTAPEIAWSYGYSKEGIRDVEVVDPHTVRFHFPTPTATDVLDAVQGVILPKHAWSRLPFSEWTARPEWFQQNLVVSGPFTLESWEPGQRFVLRRNPRYFEAGLPKVDRVVFQLVPEASAQLALLRGGQADVLEFIRPADAQSILDHPDLELRSTIPRQNVFVSWNLRNPLFAEVEVRQALTMAIDRQTIIDTLMHGYAVPSESPYISNSWVCHRSLAPWPYDPARAREVLASRGWIDRDGDGWIDRDGRPFRFELLTNADNDLRRDSLVMIQNDLKKVGIDVQPRAIEFNTLLARQGAHDFEAAIASVGIDTSLDLRYSFHSSSAASGWNWGGYSSPEADALMDAIASHFDQVADKALYDRLQEVIHRDQPVTYLYEPMRLIAHRKTLRDLEPNAISTYMHMRTWSLDEG